MKSDAALVRTDRAAELHAVAGVHMNLTVIVGPRHAELYLPFGIDEPFENGVAPELLFVRVNNNAEGFKNFLDRLMEFRLTGILLYYLFNYFIYVLHFFFSFTLYKNKKRL